MGDCVATVFATVSSMFHSWKFCQNPSCGQDFCLEARKWRTITKRNTEERKDQWVIWEYRFSVSMLSIWQITFSMRQSFLFAQTPNECDCEESWLRWKRDTNVSVEIQWKMKISQGCYVRRWEERISIQVSSIVSLTLRHDFLPSRHA